MMAPIPINMMNKTHNVECCMCGDLGLPHLLFRCAICHFRSQHRYCSNLYPKAESYKVCNWCLINKDNVVDDDQHNNIILSSFNNSDNKKLKLAANNHQTSGPSPKWLQPTSPIKKSAIRSPPVDQSRSPSGRKRITATNAQDQDQEDSIIRPSSSSSSILKRSKSTSSINIKMAKKNISDDNIKKLENVNINKKSGSGREASGGVIKHVFRNKVRRYKLLDEVSC